MQTYCIKNNRQNLNKNTIGIKKEEFEEEDITKFNEMIEQFEKALKPVEKKLEMMDVDTKHKKKN